MTRESLSPKGVKNMTLPLKWEFPRGKLEMGENEETCIQREIREEINIEIEIVKKLTHNIHDYGEFQVKFNSIYGQAH